MRYESVLAMCCSVYTNDLLVTVGMCQFKSHYKLRNIADDYAFSQIMSNIRLQKSRCEMYVQRK